MCVNVCMCAYVCIHLKICIYISDIWLHIWKTHVFMFFFSSIFYDLEYKKERLCILTTRICIWKQMFSCFSSNFYVLITKRWLLIGNPWFHFEKTQVFRGILGFHVNFMIRVTWMMVNNYDLSNWIDICPSYLYIWYWM